MENILLINNNIIWQELFERFIIAGIEIDNCKISFTIVDKLSNKFDLKTLYRAENMHNSSYCNLICCRYHINEQRIDKYDTTLEIYEWNDRLISYVNLFDEYYLYYPITGKLIWKDN